MRRGAGRPRTIAQATDGGRGSEADTVDVPLIGQIPAGLPVDAVELDEGVFRLPRTLVGHGALFMLKVTGDSMTGAAIAHGDLGVLPCEVGDAAGGWLAAECGVGAVVIVVVQPGPERVGALGVAGVGAGVGPFVGQGAVKPLDFPVGLGPAGTGPLVGHRRAEGIGEGV